MSATQFLKIGTVQYGTFPSCGSPAGREQNLGMLPVLQLPGKAMPGMDGRQGWSWRYPICFPISQPCLPPTGVA